MILISKALMVVITQTTVVLLPPSMQQIRFFHKPLHIPNLRLPSSLGCRLVSCAASKLQWPRLSSLFDK